MGLVGRRLQGVRVRTCSDGYTRVLFEIAGGVVEVTNGPAAPPRWRLFWRSVHVSTVTGRRILRFLKSLDGEWACHLEGDVYLLHRGFDVSHSPTFRPGRSLCLVDQDGAKTAQLKAFLQDMTVVNW